MLLRKYWIPITVFLVVIVGVGLYYLQTRPPKDPIVIVKPVEPIEKPTAEKSSVEIEAPVSDTPQDGHFHADGTWHDGPHETPTPVDSPSVVPPKPEVSAPVGSGARPFHDPYFRMMNGFAITSEFAMAIAPSGVGPDFAAMSAEELADAIETINSHTGYPPGDLWPPEGYHYARGGTTVLSDGENIWLDDNGHPILKKDHTPFYEIIWSEGFRPPPDVYADYKGLDKQHIRALINEMPEEAARLSTEMAAMRQMYSGRVPSGNWASGSSPSGMQPHIYYAQFSWARDQMQRSAYESEGIDYLMDRYSRLKKYANLDRYPELKEFAK